MKLRPYELKAVRELPGLLRKHKRVVAVGPTGSGKTVIAAHLVRRERPARVLFVAHRIELLRQAKKQLVASGIAARDVGILSGPEKENVGARVLVASIDMLREWELPKVSLAIVDEAHRIVAKSYRDLLDRLPGVPVLGLTATPWRLDGAPLGDVFARMHVFAEAVELIADKFIAGPIVYGVPEDKARKIVKGLASNGGEYNARQAERSAMRYLLGDVVTERARLAPGARTLVFAATRKHGKALARRFKRAGVAAEYLDGETGTAEREAMVERLRSGETEVLVNVDVLSEGFDCPPVKCVALARPTRSLTRFLQQIGRASRRWGNKRPIILDHAGNCWRFGLPTTPREWSLDGRAAAIAARDAPVRLCPECEAMVPVGCGECPECGATLPRSQREIDIERGKLEEMMARESERTAARKRIEEVARVRGASGDWVEMVLVAMFGAAE